MKKILLLSKDRDYKELLESYFINTQFKIISFNTIEELKHYLMDNSADILICDLIFGSVSITQIRNIVEDKNVLIMALNESFDNIDLKFYIESSIKEFINKKEDLRILEQRICNIISLFSNNNHRPKNKLFTFNKEKVVLDQRNRIIYKNDIPFSVTKLEVELINYLLKKKNTLVTRESICKEVWLDEKCNTRKVDTCIKNIRKKIELKSIGTIYGQGYIWRD